MAMLDLVPSMAVRGHDNVRAGVLTVNMSVVFLGASRDDVFAEGRMMHAGQPIAVCESEAGLRAPPPR
jgi:acyl-coenzyme A thioesterase PaaI-like protein